MDKQIVEQPLNEISFGHQKEGRTDISLQAEWTLENFGFFHLT